MTVKTARTCDIKPINPKEEEEEEESAVAVAEINSAIVVIMTLIVTIRWLCSPGCLYLIRKE